MTQAWNNTFPPTEAFACIVCPLNVPLTTPNINPVPSLAHCGNSYKDRARLQRQQRNEMNITPLQTAAYPPQMRCLDTPPHCTVRQTKMIPTLPRELTIKLGKHHKND